MATPPKGVQEAAARAVRWIEEGKAGRNFTDVGRDRAHQLANGDDVSAEDLRRMKAYFARHAVDRDAEGFTGGSSGFPSPGREWPGTRGVVTPAADGPSARPTRATCPRRHGAETMHRPVAVAT